MMISIDIQVSRSKIKVNGQTYSSYVGEGGISVLQTSILNFRSARQARQGARHAWTDAWHDATNYAVYVG